MYEYHVVVPERYVDEMQNVLRDEAEVRQEGVMPAPPGDGRR